jgi:hypothetical protein
MGETPPPQSHAYAACSKITKSTQRAVPSTSGPPRLRRSVPGPLKEGARSTSLPLNHGVPTLSDLTHTAKALVYTPDMRPPRPLLSKDRVTFVAEVRSVTRWGPTAQTGQSVSVNVSTIPVTVIIFPCLSPAVRSVRTASQTDRGTEPYCCQQMLNP